MTLPAVLYIPSKLSSASDKISFSCSNLHYYCKRKTQQMDSLPKLRMSCWNCCGQNKYLPYFLSLQITLSCVLQKYVSRQKYVASIKFYCLWYATVTFKFMLQKMIVIKNLSKKYVNGTTEIIHYIMFKESILFYY